MSVVKLQRAALRCRRLASQLLGRSGETYVESRVSQYRRIWGDAAESIGATLTEVSDGVWDIGRNGHATRVINYLVSLDDPVTLELTGNKPLVKRLLAEGGVPVPDGEVFRIHDLDKAYRFLGGHRAGCVIKPAHGTSAGRGITTHLTAQRQIKRAALLASLYDSTIMIEEMAEGETCRGLVLEGRLISAVRRRGIRLCGDGRSTVRGLIAAHNAHAASANGTELPIDEDCLFALSWQGLTLDAVPDDREIVVRSGGDPGRRGVEVRTVYNEDITDQVGDDFRRIVERSATIVGGDFLGVDLVSPDLSGSRARVLEVNATPGMHHHYFPQNEPYSKAAAEVLEALLRKTSL